MEPSSRAYSAINNSGVQSGRLLCSNQLQGLSRGVSADTKSSAFRPCAQRAFREFGYSFGKTAFVRARLSLLKDCDAQTWRLCYEVNSFFTMVLLAFGSLRFIAEATRRPS